MYTVKPNHPNSEPYKARFVAKGFGQVAEEDYLDTFAPTARPTTIRATVQDSWNKNYIIEQLDFETAFLNADLDVDVFIKPPEGYTPKSPGNVWRLKKCLYGLKQSSKLWNSC